jgi:hypothetical protein
MNAIRAIQAVLIFALLALLTARAVQRARTPPFEIELVHARKTELALEGITFQTNAIDTLVTVKAMYARPGHLELGPFSLSPTTSIELGGVSVEMRLPEGVFTVEGKSGELRGQELTVRHAIVKQRGLEEARRLVKIDLETATAHGE